MKIIKIALNNRERLLAQMEDGILLMKAPPEVVRNSDINYQFRQHSNFFFLTGLSEPEVIMALEKKGDRSRFTLFVYPRDKKMEIWFGSRIDRDQAKDRYGAGTARLLREFNKQLQKLLTDQPRLYLDLHEGDNFAAEMLKALGSMSANNRAGTSYPSEIVNVGSILAELRLHKQSGEVELLQKAADITAVAFRKAMRELRPGMREYELQSILEQEFQRGGGTWAYGSIVAGGTHGLILHYIENRDTLKDGDLVLIDAGAEYANYAADVTRTWPVNGKFTTAQKQIYRAVLKAQNKAIAAVKPGVTFQEIDRIATRVLVEELLRLQILKGNAAEIIRRRRHVAFYPHSTGHWLGLDTHDVGLVKPAGKERVLEPGMLLTVEPGLYFQEDRRATPARFKGIAVRIEDDVLVTSTGHQVLTAAIPKELEELEELLSQRRQQRRKSAE